MWRFAPMTVCDNVRSYGVYEVGARCTKAGGRSPLGGVRLRCNRRAREGTARGVLAVPARFGRAQWCERADALAGRAGGDEPHAHGRRSDRRRLGPAAFPALAPGRGRLGHDRARFRAFGRGEPQTGASLRGDDSRSARPALGALASHACSQRRNGRARRSADARAGLSRDRAGRAGRRRARLRRAAPRARRGRLRHLRRRSSPPFREPHRCRGGRGSGRTD